MRTSTPVSSLRKWVMWMAPAYQSAIAADPEDADAKCNLGVILRVAMGDLAGAKAAYLAAIEADPELAFAHFNLGVLLEVMGDLKGAKAAFQGAIAADPEDTRRQIAYGVYFSLALYCAFLRSIGSQVFLSLAKGPENGLR